MNHIQDKNYIIHISTACNFSVALFGREGKTAYGGPADGRKKAIFLVWAPHSVRAKGIAESLGAEVEFLNYKFKSRIYSPVKYPLLFLKSLSLLKSRKPETVICQVPPIFCAWAAIAYKIFLNRKATVAIDMHSGALEKPWSYLKPLNTAAMKKAGVVLVSNLEARNRVLQENNIRPLVLEDKIPSFDLESLHSETAEEKKRVGHSDSAKLRIVIPSSFAYDEPIKEILHAASALQDVRFYMTGDSSKARSDLLKKKPANVVLTKFLDRDDYVRLLYDSDAVMVLTTRDRTLLAGAYEAVALEKPLITSDWAPLKRYFSKGTIHINNSAEEIVAAVKTVQRRKREMAHEMGLLREEKAREWQATFARFQNQVA